jgi:hypothetical protein
MPKKHPAGEKWQADCWTDLDIFVFSQKSHFLFQKVGA